MSHRPRSASVGQAHTSAHMRRRSPRHLLRQQPRSSAGNLAGDLRAYWELDEDTLAQRRRVVRAGHSATVRAVRAAFPDLQVHVEAISDDGDHTWARVRFTGTNTGPLMGHSPTGRAATWTAIDHCRYASRKLTEHWGVADLLSMMQQVGIVPLPRRLSAPEATRCPAEIRPGDLPAIRRTPARRARHSAAP
jgi:predicted ester cyclase